MHAISDFFHIFSSPAGLEHLVSEGGMLMMALIIFAENGILAGFFLPGDSLLITAGILIGGHRVAIDFVPLLLVLILAAIVGETVGYYIGKKAGQKLYQRPDSKLFKREHLERAHHFYEKYGGKTVVLARFIPIFRTFVPVVAGAAEMDIRRFTLFNIIGGALWVTTVLLAGLLLGASVKNIGNYIYLIIGGVIIISTIPPIVEFFRARARKVTSNE